jgi:hypothetical protein
MQSIHIIHPQQQGHHTLENYPKKLIESSKIMRAIQMLLRMVSKLMRGWSMDERRGKRKKEKLETQR